MQDDEGTHASPPRTHGTPSGYRNIRVLVTRDLHFRLLSYSSQSHLSLPAFVVAWLNRATPLEASSNPPSGSTVDEPAPGHRHANDDQRAHGPAVGPVDAQGLNEPSLGHLPARGTHDVSGNAVRPCAAPSPGASATSVVPWSLDAASSRSSPTVDTAKSISPEDSDEAKAERTGS